jgi:DNA sulfur modification protein DndD
MRLLTLTIQNLGVFRGRHDFDFTPTRDANRQPRPLTVIGGQNGVGKSTLFQAIPLALHGSLVLGDRVSRQTYNDFLLSRLHRYMGTGVPVISEEASVALSFQYVQSGRPLRIHVERRWQRSSQSVSETLNVLRDGQPPEVAPEDYQDWLNDLFPPGLASVCFFDAEKLDALSSPDQHNAVLSDTLRRLLGLDLVERLRADLDRHTTLRGGRQKEAKKLRVDKAELQKQVSQLDRQIAKLQGRIAAREEAAAELAKGLEEADRRLAAEGGAYAARYPLLLEQLKEAEVGAVEIAAQFRELSNDLLPFALVPELCRRLSRSLEREGRVKSGHIAAAAWQERLSHLKEILRGDEIWEGLKDVRPHTRKLIAKRLLEKMGCAIQPDDEAGPSTLHRLSDAEREKLQNWIAQALQVIPPQVEFLGGRLRAFRFNRAKIEADLRRVPDEKALVPMHAELTRLQESLDAARRQVAELHEQAGALQYRRNEQARSLERVSQKLAEAQSTEKQLALAEHSKKILQVYKNALTAQRVGALEKSLLACFNQICRKEHLIEAVKMNPADFTLRLLSADGRALDITSFSAGERQLYALALLWALRRVSGRQLPMVIDTPFARLDEHHRSRLIHNFVPAVSDQVLLFTTDVEMDARSIGQVEPYTARVYRLHFDEEREETQVVSSAQATPGGTTLFRGETPGALGFDAHGGYGRTWTTDPEHAAGYGEVRQAVLPASSKRLVLVDPETGDFNWDGIKELQRLTKAPSLVETVKAGYQLFDIWNEEWTYILQQAGYDSIATYNIEGPEEYVLNSSKLIPTSNELVKVKGNGHDA